MVLAMEAIVLCLDGQDTSAFGCDFGRRAYLTPCAQSVMAAAAARPRTNCRDRQ